jgi:hypothetical protein
MGRRPSNPQPQQAIPVEALALTAPLRFRRAARACQRFIDARIDADQTDETLWPIDDDRWRILRGAAQVAADEFKAHGFSAAELSPTIEQLRFLDEQWTNVCRRRTVLAKKVDHSGQYRTGAPGKPTSSHLVKAELERRAATGKMSTTLAAEAEQLERWLRSEHPSAPPMAVHSIENSIRSKYRALKNP